MKKFLYLAGAALAAPVTFAEGGMTGSSSYGEVNMDAVEGVANALKTACSDYVDQILPILSTIAVGFAVFWLVRIAIRMIKSWASSAV